MTGSSNERSRLGFTLVELMIVVALIGALASLAVPSFRKYQMTAKRAEAFGMSVLHHSRRSGVPLAELLERSDVVSLHCPLTPDTRHLIGAAELRALGPRGVLINTARGPVVDEAALARALSEGRIAAAGLDVFDPEPAKQDNPLFRMENTVVSPHIGGWVREAMPRLVAITVDGMLAAMSGERPGRLANPEVWPALQERLAKPR